MTRIPAFRATAISTFAVIAAIALSAGVAQQRASSTGTGRQKGFDQPGTKWTGA